MTALVAEPREQTEPAHKPAPASLSLEAMLLPSPRPRRQRRAEPVTNRVRRDGKFFRLGDEKFYVKGVTYGPFEPNRDGDPFPNPERAQADFEQMIDLGANCLRVYHVPPQWFLDLALKMGL